MTEKDILHLIQSDAWMMDVLRIAEKVNLPDWIIGAGFVRNKVWDFLHGYEYQTAHDSDIDLIYFDPQGNDEKQDEELSQKLRTETGMKWEIVNETYSHTWNNFPPFTSAEDSLSHWSETATAIGVRMKNGTLQLVAPLGIDDLVNLVIRPNPRYTPRTKLVKERMAEKKWLEKWPKLRFVE